MHKLSRSFFSAAALALLLVAPAPRAAARQPAASIQLPDFVSLIRQEGPAVVNISTTRTVTPEEQMQSLPQGGDPLSEFFRRFMQPQGQFQEHTLGSGFIIDAGGYILTNAHVVADTDEVTVKLSTKREYKAKVIGSDPYTDVALVKIEGGDLPVVRVGSADELQVGEWVAAIGAPFGFENSVTAGIVSAKGRSLPDESYVPFIQTDVAVNPGNSGGPLFNMRAEVVGINSQIYSKTGGFMGVSFAIPIDIAMNIAQQLRTKGRVVRGRIGVQAQEMTVDLANSFGLKEVRGALVAAIEPQGPADKAGIKTGDIILAVNNKPVRAAEDMAREVAASKPGSVATLDVWRNERHNTVKVTVADLDARRPQSASAPVETGTPDVAGLILSQLTPEQGKQLGVSSGLLVRGVGGPAQRAGLQPGDVILSLNNEAVDNVVNFDSRLAQNTGKTIALLVSRDGETLFVPVKLQPRESGQGG